MTTNGTSTRQTRVVIVGGGLVGLSAALFLAWQDVPCIVLEKHLASSLHPRAMGYTPRTVELFSCVGIANEMPFPPKDFVLQRIQVESLAGNCDEGRALPWTPGGRMMEFIGVEVRRRRVLGGEQRLRRMHWSRF